MRHRHLIASVLLILLVLGCRGDGKPGLEGISGVQGPSSAVIYGPGVLKGYDRVQVFGKVKARPVAEGIFQGGFLLFDKRWSAHEDRLEIVDLPEGWTSIVFVDPQGGQLPAIRPGQPLPPPPQEPPRKIGWFLRNKLIASLLILSVLYAVLMVGVTGGPNHGEHPFLIALLHLIVFLILGRAWSDQAFNRYLALVLVLLALSFGALLLVGARLIMQILFKALLVLAYGAMFWVLSTKGMMTTACMAGPTSILIQVEEGKRNRLQILDAGKNPIREAGISPYFSGKTLYLWDDPSWPPPFLRVITPDGTTQDIKIRGR